MSEKLKRSLGRWLNCFSHRWGDTQTDSYDEGFCNGVMHVLSIILKHLYRKEPCSDPLPVQQPPSTPYPKPTMTDDDSPNVECYRLGYDVGCKKGANAMKIKIIERIENKIGPDGHLNYFESGIMAGLQYALNMIESCEA